MQQISKGPTGDFKEDVSSEHVQLKSKYTIMLCLFMLIVLKGKIPRSSWKKLDLHQDPKLPKCWESPEVPNIFLKNFINILIKGEL